MTFAHRRITGFFGRYLDASKRQHPADEDMFGTEPKGKEELLKQALEDTVADERTRFSVSAPGDADIEEAKRQCREVYDRYHNADGTAKAGWLRAPNGKHTNLDERQWVQVRTPNFKRFFGDWEALANAVMTRVARSFTEAREILGGLLNVRLENKGGLSAELSRNSIDKILSGKALDKSVSREAHLLAVANLRKLFETVTEVPPDNGNKAGVKLMHRLYAPFLMDGKILFAKISVKEFDDGTSNRLYTVEALKTEETAGNLAPKQSSETGESNPKRSQLKNTLQQLSESVNPDSVLRSWLRYSVNRAERFAIASGAENSDLESLLVAAWAAKSAWRYSGILMILG